MVASRISDYLKSNGIKQSWLAEQLDFTDTKMSNLLNGKTVLNADTFISICHVLGVSSEVFREKDS